MADADRFIEVPGRHIAQRHALFDRTRPRPGLLIGHQRHGRGGAGVMAGLAALLQNGCHVSAERDVGVERRRVGDPWAGQHHREIDTSVARGHLPPPLTVTFTSALVQQQWYPKLPANSPEPSSTTTCNRYSPGALNVAVAAARPSTILLCAGAKVTLAGPRYVTQLAVIPTGFPPRTGSPSSVAATVRVSGPGPSRVCWAGSRRTTGGVLELMRSLLPPRVVRLRSIIHTGLSEPATCSVLPCAARNHTSFWSPKSLGTTTLKTSLWRRISKCVGCPRSPPGSKR